MNNTQISKPILVCRPALAQDTPAMQEITRTIWDGHDYVPREWDHWLSDASGCLAIAELGGRVVGLARLTRFGEYDWWDQALRVHPDFRGQGIASHLHKYLLEYWERTGTGILRMTTTADRFPVHHLAEQSGFERIGEFTFFAAPAILDQPHQFSAMSAEQAQEAMMFIQQSPAMDWQCGLLNWGWEWTSPERKWILEAIDKDHAWWWNDRQGLLLAYIEEGDEGENPALTVALVAGSSEIIPIMLEDFRRLAGEMEFEDAAWVASLGEEVAPILRQAGYTRQWDNSVFLYAKKHA